ncbi:MAG: hypothetical protein KCHDKBKB_01307 [Elusimicrobia bacterium]|nr:hypothetical protein [Elusimicrobiota bacterium]
MRILRPTRHFSDWVVGCLVFLWAATGASAQDLEPRAYSNTPVGLKFLIVGYAATEGNVAFDPSVPITDAHLNTHSSVFGYAHSLGVGGRSAKFDVVMPYTWLDGDALVQGQRKDRVVSGFADPLFRFTYNFYGAPALKMKDFAHFRQNFIMGFSVRVSPPLGQYDETRLVNIGTNRWAIKPEFGMSKAWGPWTIEVMPSITVYTNNTDFFNGQKLTQEPLYAVQGHLIRSLRHGLWVAINSTYFTGARTATNGVKSDNKQSSTRTGFTLAIPVDKSNSIKLYGSAGTSTRTGSRYNALGAAWQFRWGTES